MQRIGSRLKRRSPYICQGMIAFFDGTKYYESYCSLQFPSDTLFNIKKNFFLLMRNQRWHMIDAWRFGTHFWLTNFSRTWWFTIEIISNPISKFCPLWSTCYFSRACSSEGRRLGIWTRMNPKQFSVMVSVSITFSIMINTSLFKTM